MVKGEIIFFKRFSNFNFRKKKERWKKEKKGRAYCVITLLFM